MIRVMIVDDEPYVRAEIKALIDWDAIGCVLVCEAWDGAMALKSLEEHHIDVVLTDVRMPVMDGIEFLKRTREKAWNGPVVIVSAFDDFALVRQAFVQGVVDYVVKSDLSTQALHSAIESCRPAVIVEHKRLAAASLKRLIEGRTEIRSMPGGHPVVLLGAAAAGKEYSSTRTLEWLTETCTAVTAARGLVAGWYALADSESQGDVSARIEKRLQTAAKDCHIAISRTIHSAAELATEWQSLRTAIRDAFFENPARLIRTGADRGEAPGPTIEVRSEAERLVRALVEKDQHNATESVFDRLRRSRDREATIAVFKRVAMELPRIASIEGGSNAAETSALTQGPGELEATGAPYQAFMAWFESVIQALQVADSELPATVKRALAFVDGRLLSGAKLSETAEAVGVSPEHLSRLLKRSTGKSFTEIVTSKRLAIAQDLLRRTNLKVYEVADRAGFDSPEHFSRVFRAAIGKTPREYRAANS